MIIALGLIWVWQSARWLVVLVVLAVGGLIYYSISSAKKAAADAQELQQKAIEHDLELQEIASQRELESQQVAVLRIEHHIKPLLKKARQTLHRDDYGKWVFDRWFSERDYFINEVLSSECPGVLEAVDRTWLRNAIDTRVLNLFDKSEPTDTVAIDTMSPTEFEHFCAALLRNAGWDAKVTQASGDQGIDIVAEISGFRAVFQCKLYSNPVGNAAVQEVIAGRAFERAHLAAVISNSTFTLSARQLAATAQVHLLHFSEVSEFANKLAAAGEAAD